MTVHLSENHQTSAEGKQNEPTCFLTGCVNTALTSVQRSALLQATGCKKVKGQRKSEKNTLVYSSLLHVTKNEKQSRFVHKTNLHTDDPAALDWISCSDLKPLVVYISWFNMAHSLLLSLVTTASLSESPPARREAHDWSIFLYLIAGDEQQ